MNRSTRRSWASSASVVVSLDRVGMMLVHRHRLNVWAMTTNRTTYRYAMGCHTILKALRLVSRLSLRMHDQRVEYWVFVSDAVQATKDGTPCYPRKNELSASRLVSKMRWGMLGSHCQKQLKYKFGRSYVEMTFTGSRIGRVQKRAFITPNQVKPAV